MGNYTSGYSGNFEAKETSKTFEELRLKLRSDFETHSEVIDGVKHKIMAHKLAMENFTENLNIKDKGGNETKGKRVAVEEYTNCVKEDLISQCKVLDGTLINLKQSLEIIISDYASKTLEISTKRMSKLEEENKNLKSENGSLKDSNSRLETEIRSKETDFEKLNRQKRDVETTLRTSTQQVDDLKRKYEYEKRENEENKYKIRDSERTIGILRNDIYHLEDKISRLERAKIMQKVSVPIQLYCDRKDELMMRVMDELTAMLVTQMSTHNIELGCTRCDRREDIQRDKLLLVLCINASRIGTDAGNAISGIPQPDKTALLVLHHKSVHALPNQSSDRMLTTSEFKSLGGIFDMAFLADKGIYPCDMNNAAVNGILNFVKSRSPSSS